MPRDEHSFEWRFESPVDYVPQRVVSLVPSMTESLFDLGLGDRLIAVTENCVRPQKDVELLPKVGGTQNPDIDLIISLTPDLVILNDEENRREDAQALQAVGIPIWMTGPRTVFDALNLLWDIMYLFDHAVMIPRVREIERAYDYSSAASRAAKPVNTFAAIRRNPWITFNADTFAHDMLRVCGGYNVFAAYEQRYPEVSLEEIVAAQPEVVLLPDEPYSFPEADVETIWGLDIPAARNGHIYIIDSSLLMWHGSRIAYALRDLPPMLAEGSE